MKIETKEGYPLLQAKRDIKAGESVLIGIKGTCLMETDDFKIIKYRETYCEKCKTKQSFEISDRKSGIRDWFCKKCGWHFIQE